MRSGGSQMCAKGMSVVKCLANAKTEYATSVQLSALLKRKQPFGAPVRSGSAAGQPRKRI